MATLTLRKTEYTEIEARPVKRRKLRTVTFENHKPKVHQAGPKKKRVPTFEEIFGFKGQRTTGEDILVIRAWMRNQGCKPVSEDFTFYEFANAMQWQLRPRWAWQHFSKKDAPAARRFLKACADMFLNNNTIGAAA